MASVQLMRRGVYHLIKPVPGQGRVQILQSFGRQPPRVEGDILADKTVVAETVGDGGEIGGPGI